MNQQKRIGSGGAILLLFVAAIIDLIQILSDLLVIGLILDPIISIMATIVFGVWLSHYNIWIFSGKRGWAGWTTLFVEITPLLDAIPGWIAFTSYIILTNKIDTLTV